MGEKLRESEVEKGVLKSEVAELEYKVVELEGRLSESLVVAESMKKKVRHLEVVIRGFRKKVDGGDYYKKFKATVSETRKKMRYWQQRYFDLKNKCK